MFNSELNSYIIHETTILFLFNLVSTNHHRHLLASTVGHNAITHYATFKQISRVHNRLHLLSIHHGLYYIAWASTDVLIQMFTGISCFPLFVYPSTPLFILHKNQLILLFPITLVLSQFISHLSVNIFLFLIRILKLSSILMALYDLLCFLYRFIYCTFKFVYNISNLLREVFIYFFRPQLYSASSTSAGLCNIRLCPIMFYFLLLPTVQHFHSIYHILEDYNSLKSTFLGKKEIPRK